LFLLVPFAMLPWGVAQTLWWVATAGLLVLAGYLTWSSGEDAAPLLSGGLIGWVLYNSVMLFVAGNIAGIAVGLCIVATWCFLSQRFIAAAVLLFAISLVIKPHDAGFVWLYFLLAGGVMRKRAFQTFAVAAILGVLAAIWIAPVSPHWIEELHKNHITLFQRGGINDPGLSGTSTGSLEPIIDLQAPLSVLWNEPHFYNLASYLIVGPLIFTWALMVLRGRSSPRRDRLALAAIASLSLLPVYHRPYDAKLLMLTIPALAMLWAEGGLRRWLAVALTVSGIVLTSDAPLAGPFNYANLSTSTFVGKMMIVFLLEPAPLILLAMGCFYLWAYAQPVPNPVAIQTGDAANGLTEASLV
jgi:hypothetical protein